MAARTLDKISHEHASGCCNYYKLYTAKTRKMGMPVIRQAGVSHIAGILLSISSVQSASRAKKASSERYR